MFCMINRLKTVPNWRMCKKTAGHRDPSTTKLYESERA